MPYFRKNLVSWIFVPNYWIFATLWVEICRYHDAILCKNIFRGYFIHRIFDFLPFSVLKLHFQHLILAKILYNEFLSLMIGFLQPYEKKFFDIMMQYCVKIYLKDISLIESLIFYHFPCWNFIFNTLYSLKFCIMNFCP